MKLNRVNIGEIIRQKVDECGMSQSQFASKIGLLRQNIKKTVFDKESLDTNLLCVISEVLECNFFDYYSCAAEDNLKEVRAMLTIEIGKERKEKFFRFFFGENKMENLNKDL